MTTFLSKQGRRELKRVGFIALVFVIAVAAGRGLLHVFDFLDPFHVGWFAGLIAMMVVALKMDDW